MVRQDFYFHSNYLFKGVINKKGTCSKSNHILSHIKCHIDYHDQSDLNLDSLVISHVKCFINKTLKCESVWNLIAK